MSETFAQRVERLKHNEKGWLFLSDADRDCIRKANQKGKVDNLTFEGEWEHNATGFALKVVGAHEVFRIRPDYQPESEYVDLPIEKIGYWLGVHAEGKISLPYPFMHLHCLPSLPGFVQFIVKESDFNEVWMNIEGVARAVSKHEAVMARFRKE